MRLTVPSGSGIHPFFEPVDFKKRPHQFGAGKTPRAKPEGFRFVIARAARPLPSGRQADVQLRRQKVLMTAPQLLCYGSQPLVARPEFGASQCRCREQTSIDVTDAPPHQPVLVDEKQDFFMGCRFAFRQPGKQGELPDGS